VSVGGGCDCQGGQAVILSCSGAADVGEVSDRAARLLARERAGNMSCLAGIGARLEGMIAGAREAAPLLMIDGCPTACGRRALEAASITGFVHLQLKEIGLMKGSTPRNEETIQAVAVRARELLGITGSSGAGCCSK